jgi:hypothetical protein
VLFRSAEAQVWVDLIFRELGLALKKESADCEAIAIVLDLVKTALGTEHAQIVRKRLSDFPEFLLVGNVEGDKLHEIVRDICAICPEAVNLSLLAGFLDGIGEEEDWKIDFIVVLWGALGGAMVAAAAAAFDSLERLDSETRPAEFRGLFDLALLELNLMGGDT